MDHHANLKGRTSPMIFVQLFLMALLWAGTFVAGRQTALELDPTQAATMRFGLASLILVPCAIFSAEGLPRLNARQLLITLGLGATGVAGYNLFFFAALSVMPASRTAIFVAFTPLVVLIIGAALAKTRPTPRTVFGCLLSLMGAVCLSLEGSRSLGSGMSGAEVSIGQLFMVGAVMSWAIYTILGREALQGMTPLTAITYASVSGTALLAFSMMLFSSPPEFSKISPLSVGAIIYLAVGGTLVPFLWYYKGVAQIGPSRTAAFTHLVPVFGVLLGVALLGETINVSLTAAMSLVMLGLLVANSSLGARVSISNRQIGAGKTST